MKIIDCHFHWWPKAYFERLCKRTEYPLVVHNAKGAYAYTRKAGEKPRFDSSPIWFDLDKEFEHMDSLGHELSVVSSIGPFSVHFSDLPRDEGRDGAMFWNEQIALAQAKHPGRFWGSAAMPLVDTQAAIDVLNHAVLDLGLMGVNIPGTIGDDPRIDAERLEPFYARVAELGVPLFMHPTDAYFPETMEGYDGALYLSMGRVVDLSVSASRMILSGLMERHPTLKIYLSHTGGALPYQSGRMDKNSNAAKLQHPPSTYIKRMITDTVSPHSLGVKFAIEYYGIDNVMYGSDYPCWKPKEALAVVSELRLTEEERHKLLYANAVRLLGLKMPQKVANAA